MEFRYFEFTLDESQWFMPTSQTDDSEDIQWPSDNDNHFLIGIQAAGFEYRTEEDLPKGLAACFREEFGERFAFSEIHCWQHRESGEIVGVRMIDYPHWGMPVDKR